MACIFEQKFADVPPGSRFTLYLGDNYRPVHHFKLKEPTEDYNASSEEGHLVKVPDDEMVTRSYGVFR